MKMPDLEVLPNQPEQIAKSILPYNSDDARARYLGLRSSGFAIREALRLIGKAQSTLSFWRKDPEFVSLEDRIPEFRHALAMEYANLEFLRNYRLILEKDYRVIKRSLDKGEQLTDQEQSYLLKLRSHYTPQQLQIIEALVTGEATLPGEKEFNFTDLVIRASRVREDVEITTRDRGKPELATIGDKE